MLPFRYPFRKYQRLILAEFETSQPDHKYHIVAPPGSGKTIIGLELIRRFGHPAVVFSPTTTIQAQWREKVSMFLPEERVSGVPTLDEVASIDPARLAQVNIFTYQLISTPVQSDERMRLMARQAWVNELIKRGSAPDQTAAGLRLDTMQVNNRRAYADELGRRALRLKRELLRSGSEEAVSFLHQNARDLIDRLVRHGVRTVVLDECHHLLDYWAVVLRALINRIDQPEVIGLTATLPSLEDGHEYDNYTALLGEVDFEVPTPAVVKEGDLAPYRDLVYFTQPSRREHSYLSEIQQAFETTIKEVVEQPAFLQWLTGFAGNNGKMEGKGAPIQDVSPTWHAFIQNEPVFSLAALRFLNRSGYPFDPNLPLPVEAQDELTLEDWCLLLERYGLQVLKLSSSPADHETLARLKKMLLPFGFTLTERCLRQSRSAGDLVLTFSESKDEAVAEILACEQAALGERLRAVVVTDFERMNSGAGRLAEVLDRDAGSALRLFRRLVNDPRLAPLDPVLATGRTLMVGATRGEEIIAYFMAELEKRGLQAACRSRKSTYPEVLDIAGEGKDWSSRTYVALVTRAFESGLICCLVGTRGIFGEGWDSLALNTLIDLTSVTTATSVQQLRGRSIRLDPSWPHKVAHNWDVICVAPEFEKGDVDLKRLVRRHNRFWGIVPPTHWEQLRQEAGARLAGLLHSAGPAHPAGLENEMAGEIVKGLHHIHPTLAYELELHGFRRAPYARLTRQMLQQVDNRQRIYQLWGVGQEYKNFTSAEGQLSGKELTFHTVFTIQNTLRRMLREFRASAGMTLALGAWFTLRAALELLFTSLGGVFMVVAVGLAASSALAFLLNLRSAYRLARAFFVEDRPDAILLDVGQALIEAFHAAGLLSSNVQPEHLKVILQPGGSCQVRLESASPEQARTFVQAYREIFGPVGDPRYLIWRDDTRIPDLALSPIWYILRRAFRRHITVPPAFHPVPKVLGGRKDLAENFERAWSQYVGGGKLIYTRSETGRAALLAARAQTRPRVRGTAFEVWR
jgi:hypothetical protein